MNWKYVIIGMISFILVLQGCGIIPEKKDPIEAEIELRELEKARFQPFKERNTLEGYAEFIESNPDSHMVQIARQQMDDLRYAPYEKQQTLTGYGEFIIKYPGNRNVAAARRGIETLAFQDAEKKGSLEAYQDYLTRYPNSHYDCEAKDRLNELTFRQLHEQLEKTCRFDLLLYRLTLKRRQNELNAAGKGDLADFKCFASFADLKGAPYFNTHLIYLNDSMPEKILSGNTSGELFDNLLSEALTYLFANFRGKSKIYGFSFEVAASPFGFCKAPKRVVQYYFPMDAVDRFARGRINKEELLANVITDSR